MAWPEKGALGLLATIALGILFFASTGQPAPGIHQATGLAWWSLFAGGMWIVARNAVLPIWLFLRLIDLLAGGPARRRPQWSEPRPAATEPPVLVMPTWAAGTYEYVTTGLAGLLQILLGLGFIAAIGGIAIIAAVSLGFMH